MAEPPEARGGALGHAAGAGAVWMIQKPGRAGHRSWASLLGRIRLVGGKQSLAHHAPASTRPGETLRSSDQPLLRPTAQYRTSIIASHSGLDRVDVHHLQLCGAARRQSRISTGLRTANTLPEQVGEHHWARERCYERGPRLEG